IWRMKDGGGRHVVNHVTMKQPVAGAFWGPGQIKGMPRIDTFGHYLPPLRFRVVNEASRIADADNGEIKTVQMHRMSHGCGVDDPPMHRFTRPVSEVLGRRPRLAVNRKNRFCAAGRIDPGPCHDSEYAIVFSHSG